MAREIVKRSRGLATREEIVRVAVDVASAEGLEGLTIGRLARRLEMSKSGLFAHFGSKEELQLAVVESAGRQFEADVVEPAAEQESGLARLASLLLGWLKSVEETANRGGCFFAAASAEFDDRPGAVREEIAELSGRWREMLSEEAEAARARGELGEACDPAQVAFELHAAAQEANWARQLLRTENEFTRARRSARRCLERECTEVGRQVLDAKWTDND